MTTTMRTNDNAADTVVREVRLAKESLARRYDFDVRRIAAAIREKQGQSGHKIVSRERPKA